MDHNKTYRNIINKFYLVVVCVFSAITLLPSFVIVFNLIKNGIAYIDIDFLIKNQPSITEIMWQRINNSSVIDGGIANAILGTLYMVSIGMFIAIPLGIFAGIYLTNSKRTILTNILNYSFNLISVTPHIIIGLVVYLWIAKPFNTFSALAGGFSIAFITFPFMTKQTITVLNKIPKGITEAGLALGLNYSSVILRIVIPLAKRGLLAGAFLSISKALGITTPLIITALGSSYVNWDILKPTASLTLSLWNLFNNPNMINFMWATALLLLILITFFYCIGKHLNREWEKKII
ncbi:phosphate transport system permease protein [Dysgonomonadaceae bacterium PH5-43]|nr:phosphate transport system permease protein [Dysgonomonadaceae bacterium PH5-43]